MQAHYCRLLVCERFLPRIVIEYLGEWEVALIGKLYISSATLKKRLRTEFLHARLHRVDLHGFYLNRYLWDLHLTRQVEELVDLEGCEGWVRFRDPARCRSNYCSYCGFRPHADDSD